MAWNIVPVDSHPDQDIAVTVEVSGKNIPLRLHIRWNWTYEYWFMSIYDGISGDMLVDAIPMVTGDYPAADLLKQYQHLGIGSALIVPVSEEVSSDRPNADNLGTEYVLVWGDGDV